MKKKLFIIAGVGVIIIAMYFMFLQYKPVETVGYKINNSDYKDIISSIGTVEYKGNVEVKAEVGGNPY